MIKRVFVILMVLSICMLSQSACASKLPDPVELNADVKAPSFSMISAGGQTLTSENYGNGKDLLLVYGRVNCYNTRSFLDGIQEGMEELAANGITVLVGLHDDPSDELMNEFADKFKGIVCGKVSDYYHESGMWTGLEAVGAGTNSVIFPVVFIRSADGRLRYYSTGYVSDPMAVAAAAVKMKNENNQQEEIPEHEYTLDQRIYVKDGIYMTVPSTTYLYREDKNGRSYTDRETSLHFTIREYDTSLSEAEIRNTYYQNYSNYHCYNIHTVRNVHYGEQSSDDGFHHVYLTFNTANGRVAITLSWYNSWDKDLVLSVMNTLEYTGEYTTPPGPSMTPPPIPTPAPQRVFIEEFVTRCYRIILDRAPDAGGLNNWANALESGSQAAANIIDGFVNSQEFLNKQYNDADAVTILYLAMLDRSPDDAGLAYWVDKLSQGETFASIINGFCGSQEFIQLCNQYGIIPGSVDAAPVGKRAKIEAFVKRCYQIILSRDPDAGGLNNWANALESGAQAASNIIDGFVNSQEFLNKHLSSSEAVEVLYMAMLNRGSDAAGKANWVNTLNNGQPFAAIINGFCGSQEFIALCNEYGIQPGSVPVPGTLLQGVPEDAAVIGADAVDDVADEAAAAAEPEEAAAPAAEPVSETGNEDSGITLSEKVETADGTVPEESETMEAAVEEEAAADAVMDEEPSADADGAAAAAADPDKEEADTAAAAEEDKTDAAVIEEGIQDLSGVDADDALAGISEEDTDAQLDVIDVFEVSEEEILALDDAEIIELGDADDPGPAKEEKPAPAEVEDAAPAEAQAPAPAETEKAAPAEAEEAAPEESEELPPEEPDRNEPAPANPNEGKIRDFVSHCYAAVLGREADEESLNDYTRQIATGAKTPEQIARYFFFSAEFQRKQLSHEELVRVLYRMYLYREADDEGFAGWVEQLDAGISLADILSGFADSGEFKAVINGLK